MSRTGRSSRSGRIGRGGGWWARLYRVLRYRVRPLCGRGSRRCGSGSRPRRRGLRARRGRSHRRPARSSRRSTHRSGYVAAVRSFGVERAPCIRRERVCARSVDDARTLVRGCDAYAVGGRAIGEKDGEVVDPESYRLVALAQDVAAGQEEGEDEKGGPHRFYWSVTVSARQAVRRGRRRWRTERRPRRTARRASRARSRCRRAGWSFGRRCRPCNGRGRTTARSQPSSRPCRRTGRR